MSLRLRSGQPLVPDVPCEMTGPCVYGYIITDEHKAHFRGEHPHIEVAEDADHETVVDIAAAHTPGHYMAHTTMVRDDQGDKKVKVCLMLLDHRLRDRVIDLRWTNEWITAMETALGIKGKPDWYPFVKVTVR